MKTIMFLTALLFSGITFSAELTIEQFEINLKLFETDTQQLNCAAKIGAAIKQGSKGGFIRKALPVDMELEYPSLPQVLKEFGNFWIYFIRRSSDTSAEKNIEYLIKDITKYHTVGVIKVKDKEDRKKDYFLILYKFSDNKFKGYNPCTYVYEELKIEEIKDRSVLPKASYIKVLNF